MAENVADRDESQEKRIFMIGELYALATLNLNMLKTSNRCKAARKLRGEIIMIRRSMILNVAANGRNEDHNFQNCSISTPIGLDPFFRSWLDRDDRRKVAAM
ncbi:hypothetical protein DPMN_154907 [Dreissena polymorpha]|uniref:Uncharacterized protein n=1 Tax=Dreissena polymorpha TaxID=45954 RepID=A0A9D4J7E8_DREPO|nr:hypothetical protein DPMN_154907 [Dreissena polymorpha]